jgi:hypothetical protein
VAKRVKITRTYRVAHGRAFMAQSAGLRRAMLVRGLAVQTESKKRLNEAPRRIDTGRLRNSIQLVESKYRSLPSVRIGTNVDYAMIIHDGSRPHVILPRNASVLAWRGNGGMVFAKRVNHPGFPANPFLKDGLRRGMAKFSG